MAARKKKATRKSPKKKRVPRSPALKRSRRPTPTGKRDRGGRPAIDWTEQAAVDVHRMARADNTVADMAAILDVGKRSLELAIQQNDTIGGAYRRGLAERRDAIRTAQLRYALRGNPALLIWLGKQELGQREPPRAVELTGADGEPIELRGDLEPILKQRITAFLRSRGKKGPDD